MLSARQRESVMDGMAGLPPKGTDAAHPAGQYGAIAKLFHWVTLGLMLVALPLGFVIQHVKDASKMGFYALHESAGLTILFVALARLAWRWLSPPPSLPNDMPKMFRTASAAVHRWNADADDLMRAGQPGSPESPAIIWSLIPIRKGISGARFSISRCTDRPRLTIEARKASGN